ncbi:alpha/beta fold hydrolase [Goodfellowiella coeruleoviolacea]|uniref:Alpha/beta hydrolase family protein n=1 Tax=Goodfellowiella coeruleoviolacea TaxID=334858 RepID=A0AAE3GJ83_9PSEU|nr:alpha/beta hydrolase [Goodfellowiella coeruleoviolacea]MCP2168324.1 Alpha/beta hydrolase family protein [Goodfellowiella coeruleoviolacea]
MIHSIPPRLSGPPARVAVLLPGAGSDEVFVRAVFAEPLALLGVEVVAPAPRPGPDLVDHWLAALDAAAGAGPVLVGGISLGGHLAARWALANPHRCAGLLVALPGWHGSPEGAPGALSARASAAAVTRLGLAGALARARQGAPAWLAEELGRAWPRHGSGLAASLLAAAACPAPTPAELRGLTLPVGVAACRDDPVHPLAVAREWVAALPHAQLRTTTLAALGVDRQALGRAAVLAWLRAHHRHRHRNHGTTAQHGPAQHEPGR